MTAHAWLVWLPGSYLLGSVPFALIIGRLYGIDIREHGSGNVGATNVVRVLGKIPGFACFLLDFLKGFAAVAIASQLAALAWAPLLAGVAVILGHSRSVFLGFGGGKSVATGAGVMMALAWPVGLSALAVWLVVLGLGRIVSLASIAAAAALPVLMTVFGLPVAYRAFALLAAAFVIVRHRSNLVRLWRRQEPRIGGRKA